MDKFCLALHISAKKENIKFRKNTSDGIWVSLLLPVALLMAGRKSQSQLYTSSVIYSLNLLLNVFHLFYHIYRNKSIYVTKKINLFCIFPSSVTLFLYINILHLDMKQGLCYTIANALIFFEGLPFILKVFPSSFTFGEANLVIQGLSLFLYSTFTSLNKVMFNTVQNDEQSVCTTVLQVGLVGMLLVCLVPFIFQTMRNSLSMYMWIPVVIFGFITISTNHILGENSLLWLWSFFMKKERLPILLLWLLCTVICGMICWQRITIKKQADTISRKYFHVLGDIVFITGVIFDKNLTYFASGCALAVFILLETFRVMQIPPLYDFLQNAFILYADEKDSGIIALTPIFLLIGYSIPLWLHPLRVYSSKDNLALLSGVVCVGIGDTFASIVGKKMGKHRWKGSKKTIEGTIACACGQAAFVTMFQHFADVSLSNFEVATVFLAIVTSSAVEAFTDQIDNIILPLITYTLLIF